MTYEFKDLQISFFERLSSNASRLVRRFLLVSYDGLNVENFYAQLSGVTRAPSASVLASLVSRL